ncbi:unnamed protein product [[Candida] boidinii]|nr:unnamed protein product [[Candida] boidinii]
MKTKRLSFLNYDLENSESSSSLNQNNNTNNNNRDDEFKGKKFKSNDKSSSSSSSLATATASANNLKGSKRGKLKLKSNSNSLKQKLKDEDSKKKKLLLSSKNSLRNKSGLNELVTSGISTSSPSNKRQRLMIADGNDDDDTLESIGAHVQEEEKYLPHITISKIQILNSMMKINNKDIIMMISMTINQILVLAVILIVHQV